MMQSLSAVALLVNSANALSVGSLRTSSVVRTAPMTMQVAAPAPAKTKVRATEREA